jgi:type II secretory pathway component PulM
VWIGRLQQQYGISVDSASIERAANPGEVNANLTFIRGAT